MLEKIGQNIGKIFLGIIAIALFIFGYQCGSKNSNTPEVTKNTSDTTSTHKRDTILPKDTVFSFKDKPVPYPVYIHDTLEVLKPIDSLDLHRFFVYNDSIEDSNVKIYSKIVTQGKTLNSFKPSYKLKVPLVIIDSVTTTIRDSIFSTKLPKYQLSFGVVASPKMLAPIVDLTVNRSTYGVGYDPFNKQPIIKYSFRLWKSKK